MDTEVAECIATVPCVLWMKKIQTDSKAMHKTNEKIIPAPQQLAELHDKAVLSLQISKRIYRVRGISFSTCFSCYTL